MPSYCFLHQLRFLRWTLVVLAKNIISQPFPWLVVNKSYKICLALQCVRVCSASEWLYVVQSFFFTKVSSLLRAD